MISWGTNRKTCPYFMDWALAIPLSQAFLMYHTFCRIVAGTFEGRLQNGVAGFLF